MSRSVFICHSSADARTARDICARLEAAGIGCWIAPRDPVPGVPYGQQLVDAIASSQIVLLLLSRHANESRAVLNELELASNRHKIILPVRIEDSQPAKSIEFYVRSIHWYDAIGRSLEESWPDFLQYVKDLVANGEQAIRQAMVPSLPEPPRGNLPSYLSSFVGRETELAELRELLAKHRLVTITGPGGIGKTRLAVELAASAAAEFADGAWFVDLSSLGDPTLIAQSIAQAIGIREVSHESLAETLAHQLRRRHLLLVIDNAEHMLKEVAALVALLTSRSPNLWVIATSREPLHVAGESGFRIGPIADAPQLFQQRAREVDANLKVSADDAVVLSLCQKLDGMPLAIELAAARLTSLSPQQLDGRISAGLSLLALKGDATERHHTIESTIDWSFELLNEHEKRCFAAVGYFADGFTLEAFEAVSPAFAATAHPIDLLQSLIDKSLVTMAPTNAGPRYHMLDTIQAYSRSRMDRGGNPDLLPTLHFEFYRNLATRQAQLGDAKARNYWMSDVGIELGNCRLALEWSIEARDAGSGELLCGLAAFWQSRGLLTEGRTWLNRYLEVFKADDPLYTRALRYAAFFAASRDDHREALVLSKKLLGMARKRGDELAQAEAFHALAAIEHRRGHFEQSASLYGQALAIFDDKHNARGALVTILNLVGVLLDEGEHTECAVLLRQATKLAKTVKDDELTALSLGLRGCYALAQNRLSTAEKLMRDALVLQSTTGSSRCVEDMSSLAEVLARRGRLDEARALVCKSLAESLRSAEHNNVIRSLEVSAYVLYRAHQDVKAAECLGIATHLRRVYAYRTQTLSDMPSLQAGLSRRLGSRLQPILREAGLSEWHASAASMQASLL